MHQHCWQLQHGGGSGTSCQNPWFPDCAARCSVSGDPSLRIEAGRRRVRCVASRPRHAMASAPPDHDFLLTTHVQVVQLTGVRV